MATPALSGADTAWVLTATSLVLFMTLPGLALFYSGLVRGKNALSILVQCFAITCVVSILWFAAGYSLAFTNGGSANAFIGGLDRAFLGGLTRDSLTGTIPESLFAMFQMTFAIITPALVIGGYAERIRFSVVLWFSALWLLLVYVPITHWIWGGGWLAQMGVMDFAGGIVVHISAGVSALVACADDRPAARFPQRADFAAQPAAGGGGAGMLWVGWFGFNGGRALAANGIAAMAWWPRTSAACAGALTWLFVEWLRYGKPTALGIITGTVAAWAPLRRPRDSWARPELVIGFVAGVVCFFATQLLKRVLHIDDSLDVSPVHGVGGVVGTLLTGVFAATALGGSGFTVQPGIASQLGIQALGVGVAILWCGGITWVLLKMLDVLLGLRVTDEQESVGLDLAAHGERGYSP